MSTKTNLPILIALLAASAAACSANGEAASQSSEQTVSAEACAAAQTWAEWKSYAVGDVVTFGGSPYACVQSHTSQPGWTPAAVAALWSPVACAGGGTGGGNTGGNTGGGGSTGGSCNASAWVSMASNASACDGHLGESCGWTATNLGQGYHCQATSWGTGCEPGGATCPGGTGGGTGGGTTTPPPAPPAPPPPPAPPGGGTGGTASGFVFGPYKDTSINMNWNTNVISTTVSGAATPMVSDLTASGGKSVTLAFATGECGSENWGGVPGAAMAAANAASLSAAGVKYILSTGGAAGSFTCGSDAGMATFLGRWASAGLIGVDFDIEAGQSQAVITGLLQRIKVAHASYPGLRFSLTLATLANNNGASTAQSLGASAPDSFNVYGDWTMAAAKSTFGFNGSAASWPSYVTVNLMTMDFGSPSAGVCVVSGGACQMGQSSLQAAYNLHDKWGVPYANIELTPMIGGNDVSSETFTLGDADTVARFASAQGLAGVHYWSYDRDIDCPPGSASPTCNSMGGAGAHGFLKRFLAAGLK
jgi:chitinase